MLSVDDEEPCHQRGVYCAGHQPCCRLRYCWHMCLCVEASKQATCIVVVATERSANQLFLDSLTRCLGLWTSLLTRWGAVFTWSSPAPALAVHYKTLPQWQVPCLGSRASLAFNAPPPFWLVAKYVKRSIDMDVFVITQETLTRTRVD